MLVKLSTQKPSTGIEISIMSLKKSADCGNSGHTVYVAKHDSQAKL